MKKSLILVSLGVASALSTYFIRAQVHNPPFDQLNTGFTVTLTETHQVAGKDPEEKGWATRAFRKDGSNVMVTRSDMNLRIIVDLPKNANIYTAGGMKAYSTFYIEPNAREQGLKDLTWCQHVVDHGILNTSHGEANMEKLHGYDVIHTVLPSRWMDNDIQNEADSSAADGVRGVMSPRNEKWFAPALACVMIQEKTVHPAQPITPTNPFGGPEVTIMRTASEITLGDPDPALFAIPDDWDELSPGQITERRKGLGHVPVCGPNDARCREIEREAKRVTDKKDVMYWASQAYKPIEPRQ